jgi:hypothetical protein
MCADRLARSDECGSHRSGWVWSPASDQMFGLVTAGGMTPRMTSAASRCPQRRASDGHALNPRPSDTSRCEIVRPVPPRRIVAAHVRCVVRQVPARTIGCQRLGCQSGCHQRCGWRPGRPKDAVVTGGRLVRSPAKADPHSRLRHPLENRMEGSGRAGAHPSRQQLVVSSADCYGPRRLEQRMRGGDHGTSQRGPHPAGL